MLDYGRILPSIWLEHSEEEFSRRISRICNVDDKESGVIFNVLVNIFRGLPKKDFISKRASDLKKIGFKQADVKKFRRIATLLKQQKAEKAIEKVDAWRELSEEVLPHLYSIEYSYDIRCSVKGNKIRGSFPMVLIKLVVGRRKDGSTKEITFQMDIGTLKNLARDFTRIYKEARTLIKYRVQPERRKK